MNRLTQGALAEFIGTFMFVFVSAGLAISARGNPNITPLIIALGTGLALAVPISCFVYISGGQLNPAVSIALVVAQRQSPLFAAVFIVAQLLGAACGAGMLQFIFLDAANAPNVNLGATIGTFTEAGNVLGLIGLEALCTFMLMTSVLLAVVDQRAHRLGGLPVGLTVMACALFAGPWTGASFNPARTFGPAICGRHWDMHWAYWVGPVLGACLAAAAYRAFWSQPPTDLPRSTRRGDGDGDRLEVVEMEITERRIG